MTTHAAIVPLIGGEVYAMHNVFDIEPEYFLTYTGFQANETHLRNYYPNVPYLNLSEGETPAEAYVDVVSTVCPCAGLSSLSPSASSDNAMNDWMYQSAEHVLGEIKPKVFWGENAPRLATKAGKPVVNRLRQIGEDNGYTFSIFKTKSLLHGLPQVRNRTFYFFWQGDRIPILEYINETPPSIADFIRNVHHDDLDMMSHQLTNDNVPSEDPLYRYVLEVIEGGKTHSEFQSSLDRTTSTFDWIEAHTTYDKVAIWLRQKGYDRVADKCDRMAVKLAAGGNIMRKGVQIPVDKIGAFVGHMPGMLTHPDEDRFITVREALAIMAMPADFQLLNARRNLNHMCQNVPVTTAEHPARQIQKYLNDELEMISADYLIQDNNSRTHQVIDTGPAPQQFRNIFK